MTHAYALFHILLALTASPLLLALINRVKAFFGGRSGPPLLQSYYDLFKLLRKGAVYSRTTSWVFRAGPVVGLAAALIALLLVPLGDIPALVAFPGDLLLMAYTLGLMRFFTVIAALDTGSAFEGMGASREVQFSALTEVALLTGLAAISAKVHAVSLSTLSSQVWAGVPAWEGGATVLLASGALLVVLLAENARIPFDDPNTHLELTMIHEVMILDNGGVDLALIEYASAIKFWVLSALLVSIALPLRTTVPVLNLALGLGAMLILGVVVGCIESMMARLRLVRVPQLIVAAGVLSLLAVIMAVR
ncbi:MAG TPA: NADH-quinone oxidoreductase subunit H [Anaerolineae bacterium]|nr:NADH-quinone oxidoreductase subunit H [Anaerolineae bacterium]